MEEHTLIANSGIQLITFPLVINTKDNVSSMKYNPLKIWQ